MAAMSPKPWSNWLKRSGGSRESRVVLKCLFVSGPHFCDALATVEAGVTRWAPNAFLSYNGGEKVASMQFNDDDTSSLWNYVKPDEHLSNCSCLKCSYVKPRNWLSDCAKPVLMLNLLFAGAGQLLADGTVAETWNLKVTSTHCFSCLIPADYDEIILESRSSELLLRNLKSDIGGVP